VYSELLAAAKLLCLYNPDPLRVIPSVLRTAIGDRVGVRVSNEQHGRGLIA